MRKVLLKYFFFYLDIRRVRVGFYYIIPILVLIMPILYREEMIVDGRYQTYFLSELKTGLLFKLV